MGGSDSIEMAWLVVLLFLLGYWYLSWLMGIIFCEGNVARLYTSSNGTLCRGFTCLPKVHLLCHTCVAELVC